jgi:lipopolysaccharide export system ATP-binding protein
MTQQHTLMAKDLGKSYKKRQVVNNVSLVIQSGEIVGLLGPNGAGKTTCFYMVVGLVAADRGQVLLGNQDITQLPMHARARLGIGYLPQEPSIFRKLSVKDNILGILETRKDLSRKDRQTLLDSLLNEFNITAIRDNLGISLSGGERRRVEIARAIAANPQFMLLDEPFAGVDPISVNDIKQIIRQLQQRNIGILITDHNVRETLDVCERAYIVGSGEIITHGEPSAILANQRVREIYLGEEFTL